MWKAIRDRWTAFWMKNVYPDDPKERARIKAYILGAGAGAAMKANDGVVKVEVQKEGCLEKGSPSKAQISQQNRGLSKQGEA